MTTPSTKHVMTDAEHKVFCASVEVWMQLFGKLTVMLAKLRPTQSPPPFPAAAEFDRRTQAAVARVMTCVTTEAGNLMRWADDVTAEHARALARAKTFGVTEEPATAMIVGVNGKEQPTGKGRPS